MQAYRLIPHPARGPQLVSGIEARVKNSDPNWLTIRWRIESASELKIPSIKSKERADDLWKTTCFELFMRPVGGEEYLEWNFSPSRKWNAYAFDSYRTGMRERVVARAPDSVWHGGKGFALFDVAIPRAELPIVECQLGIAAVIEEDGGAISYWALDHSDAERPDFHHSACFAATLHPRVKE